ncbi:hypothetical protein EMPS_04181 [Entomortierella parvispora]|uniref:Uncharacterized protein n=1 Tax=Entomortierella parvispora TaxID=205924 RepID=A0A9P3H847_9FUNG|nr:hypothetical protein EMPS_04181 [Entomortierella parvispora]
MSSISNSSSNADSLSQNTSRGITPQTSSSIARASPTKAIHYPGESTHTTTDASGYPDKRDGLTASSPPQAMQDPHEHHKYNQVQNDPSVNHGTIVSDPHDRDNYYQVQGSKQDAIVADTAVSSGGGHTAKGAKGSTLHDKDHDHHHSVNSASDPLQDPLHQPLVETMEQLGHSGLRKVTGVPNYIK